MTHETPAERVAYAADRLLASNPTDRDRALAEMLNYLAATWGQQHAYLQQHAVAVASGIVKELG